MLNAIGQALDLKSAGILVVDDNPVNVKLLVKMLEADGYVQVEGITDPTLALPKFQTGEFDAVLLDIHMPGLSGFDVMAQLSQVLSQDDFLPVLILTADTNQDTRLLALASGAKDFIAKPFDRVEVLFRVKNIIETSILHKTVQDHRDRLDEKVKERTRQLYELQLELIRCLGKAAEFRDNETGMHVIRMSQASALVAKQMGLDDHQCDLILHASPMHDVGKIAIPDDILLKEGPLVGEEWTEMKTHAEIGAELLSGYDSELLSTAASLAKTHHEKWDGSGYPAGLKGEEIPLFSRIVAVCDVFDALTSKRPYKDPWTVEDTLSYLHERSGSDFDPQVVLAFEKCVDEVVDIRRQFPDLHT